MRRDIVKNSAITLKNANLIKSLQVFTAGALWGKFQMTTPSNEAGKIYMQLRKSPNQDLLMSISTFSGSYAVSVEPMKGFVDHGKVLIDLFPKVKERYKGGAVEARYFFELPENPSAEAIEIAYVAAKKEFQRMVQGAGVPDYERFMGGDALNLIDSAYNILMIEASLRDAKEGFAHQVKETINRQY